MIESWSQAKPGRERNGDSHCAVMEQDDRTGEYDRIFATLTDGVGSRRADGKASGTACDVFRARLESPTEEMTETRLADAVDAAHWAVRELRGGFAGGMTTMCAFALEVECSTDPTCGAKC